MLMTELFTIGHSNHGLLEFLGILNKLGIRVLVDIRSEPYSRYSPQFNRSDLQHHLEAAGIQYRYSGAAIGGKPRDPSLYTPAGKPDYDGLAATAAFRDELKAVVEIARTRRVALMCSEADPAACHRERIIAPMLRGWGITVTNIMPDGTTGEPEQKNLF